MFINSALGIPPGKGNPELIDARVSRGQNTIHSECI